MSLMEKGDEINNGEWQSRVCGRRFALARSQSAIDGRSLKADPPDYLFISSASRTTYDFFIYMRASNL